MDNSSSNLEFDKDGHDVVILDNFFNSNPLVADRVARIAGLKADLRAWRWQLHRHPIAANTTKSLQEPFMADAA